LYLKTARAGVCSTSSKRWLSHLTHLEVAIPSD
jgi:hypothetical protein